ncbi:MAG: hypothetical protein JO306_11675 [Gemmatimonadetes bacterium]|nr:hypothetical protein [Gemmatimonadota bacterium]
MQQAPTFRARTVPEVLDAAFQVIRARYVDMFLAVGLVTFPAYALDLFIPDELSKLGTLIHGFLMMFGAAAVVVIASDAYVGRQRSVREAVGAALSRWGSLWGVSLMKNLLIGFGILFLVVPGVIALIVTFAMVPAVMVEDASTSDAFDRSRALARDQWGRVFVSVVLGFGMMYVAYFSLLLGIGVVIGLLGGNVTPSADAIMSQFFYAAIYPLPVTVATLMYYDLRVRKEGFDLEMMTAGLPPVPVPEIPAY